MSVAPSNGDQVSRRLIGTTDLSDCASTVPPEDIPAAVVQWEIDGGWQPLPTHGRLEYARLGDEEWTFIFYHSGLIIRMATAGGGR